MDNQASKGNILASNNSKWTHFKPRISKPIVTIREWKPKPKAKAGLKKPEPMLYFGSVLPEPSKWVHFKPRIGLARVDYDFSRRNVGVQIDMDVISGLAKVISLAMVVKVHPARPAMLSTMGTGCNPVLYAPSVSWLSGFGHQRCEIHNVETACKALSKFS